MKLAFSFVSIVFFNVFSLAGCSPSGEKDLKYPYAPNQPHYFIGANLMRCPFRVGFPIEEEDLVDWPHKYFECRFDDEGRLICVKSRCRDELQWEMRYLYHESGGVKESCWTWPYKRTVRTYSPTGKLIEKTENSGFDLLEEPVDQRGQPTGSVPLAGQPESPKIP